MRPDAKPGTDASKPDSTKPDSAKPDSAKPDSAKPGAAKTDKPATAASNKKDPVELAFALPRGVTLRPDQQAAYAKLKKDYQPQVKDALEKVEKATLDQEKSKAAHELLHVKQDIKNEIKNILAMPDPNANQQQQQQPKRRRYGGYIQ